MAMSVIQGGRVMNSGVAHHQAVGQAANKPRGMIGGSIAFVLELFIWLAVALFFNILIELIGIFFQYWKVSGAAHSAQMIQTELNWLNRDFSGVFGNPAQTSVEFSRSFYQSIFVWLGYDTLAALKESPRFSMYAEYIEAAANMIYLFAMRLVVIVFSFPVFFVFGSIGLIDGLSQRDLRRFGGDRESSYFWNRVVRFIKPMFILPFVIYLASPMSIHPSLVMLPFALCFGFTIWLSSLKFKKYL